jgi:hypothetical protein
MAVSLAPVPGRPAETYGQAVHRFDYDASKPFNIREITVVERGGVKVHDITYVGVKGPVPAYLVVPRYFVGTLDDGWIAIYEPQGVSR